MSDLQLSPARLAKMLTQAKQAATESERQRCVQITADMRDDLRGRGMESLAQQLDVLITSLDAAGTLAIKITTDARLPKGEVQLRHPVTDEVSARIVGLDTYTEEELPAVHHMDDFEEGRALVQGGMFRRVGGTHPRD